MASVLATSMQRWMSDNVYDPLKQDYIAKKPPAQKYRDMSGKFAKKSEYIEGPDPTNGIWTDKVEYNIPAETMTIKFKPKKLKSGKTKPPFVAIYPDVSQEEYEKIKAGATTKDGRPNSVGAALHRSEHYSNYY